MQLLQCFCFKRFSYNTVEEETNLAGTAILMLHKLKAYATACRSNGPVLLRRSTRQMNAGLAISTILARELGTTVLRNENYIRAMQRLDDHLAVERLADRYYDELGFVS